MRWGGSWGLGKTQSSRPLLISSLESPHESMSSSDPSWTFPQKVKWIGNRCPSTYYKWVLSVNTSYFRRRGESTWESLAEPSPQATSFSIREGITIKVIKWRRNPYSLPKGFPPFLHLLPLQRKLICVGNGFQLDLFMHRKRSPNGFLSPHRRISHILVPFPQFPFHHRHATTTSIEGRRNTARTELRQKRAIGRRSGFPPPPYTRNTLYKMREVQDFK